MSLFHSKPVQPPRVSTDTVIPLHYYDDTKVMRAFVLNLGMRFDDVLDPERLRAALERLCELGNWRKIGARLRLNDKGKLEYHIPEQFDAKRPGFIFSHDTYDMNIEDHPLAKRLPKPIDKPSLYEDGGNFDALTRRKDNPLTWEEFTQTDDPQMSLHVTSFRDATIVGFTWPHWLFDAMGKASFMQAFQSVLNGDENKVPPLEGFQTDPMVELGKTTPGERHVLFSRLLQGLSMYLFIFRFLFELLYWRKFESHVVCLPAKHVQSMRETAIEELADGSSEKERPFVSDGDVICAWWMKRALQHLPRNSKRTVLVMNAFNLRSRLPKSFVQGAGYAQNAVFAIYTLISVRDVFQKPISFLAAKIRHDIKEQATEEQLHALAAMQKQAIDKSGHGCIFGDSSIQLLAFSNWSKAKFYDIDLSTAVIREGTSTGSRANHLGRPSYIQCTGKAHGMSTRFACPIIGQDAAGNYWLRAELPVSTWRKIDAQFANDQF
ncbi:MAG: hypothetical protein M1820_005709 [Bogoriella megaspora]|nr:MAG: hypothetical protein M1820_005709 [Bogoriella megaspora]